ncbi:hypothetical protein GCM10016234_40860 [Tianweitania populi]|uniref:Uncharacterized protein n=1 Tax=Tianweitania populi TaxID=1607949 RepID=A0A8J3DYJ5_9HYPH|nr:hypothetical protein GCM10016234_40860 [Tianweitania populi]
MILVAVSTITSPIWRYAFEVPAPAVNAFARCANIFGGPANIITVVPAEPLPYHKYE